MTDSSARQDYDLSALLQQASDALYKAREKELYQYGVSPIGAMALFVIQTVGDKATPAEIARWLFREPHSVTGLVNRMVKEGLVRKARDLDKKNLVKVTLTEKGQQALHQSSESQSIQRILSSLSKEEKQQLGLLLEKLRDGAHKDLGISYKMPYP